MRGSMNIFRNQMEMDSKKGFETPLHWLNVVTRVQRGFMEIDESTVPSLPFII